MDGLVHKEPFSGGRWEICPTPDSGPYYYLKNEEQFRNNQTRNRYNVGLGKRSQPSYSSVYSPDITISADST